MIKKVFWVLVLVNAGLFAYVRWGALLTPGTSSLEPALNPEKIKLLGFAPSSAPHAPAPASAPVPAAPPAPAAPPPPAPAPANGGVHESTRTPAPAAAAMACYEWGEFSGSDLASAKQDLAGLKLGSVLTEREVEHSIGYWVYIPPAKTRAAVNARVAALKKHGIKDFFVVKDKGKWHDAISLNVFKTRELAENFQRHVKAKGVKGAVIGERQTRLKFTVFTFRNPQLATLARLKEWQQGFTGINVKPAACR